MIVGGVDTLCRYTVHGFKALESVSAGLCKPFGRHRDGINLSEAAALFVMSKEQGPVELQGILCVLQGCLSSLPMYRHHRLI